MIKNFVLDTNILLYDSKSLFMFEDNNVYIPIPVLEELDHFKKKMNELGENARKVIRSLDELREHGPLSQGVPNKNGGRIFVVNFTNFEDLDLDHRYADNKLLYISRVLQNEIEGDVVLVTKDINLRVKSDAVGIKSEDYKKAKEDDEIYKGFVELHTDSNSIDELYDNKSIEIENPGVENQYYIIKSDDGESKSALGKLVDGKINLINTNQKAVNISPRNAGQIFALDALLSPSIKVVTLIGKSGTGKTLLATGAGLHHVFQDESHDKITITRPVIQVGEEIGFLPGSISDKLDPWMKPIYDALDLIRDNDRRSGKSKIPLNFSDEDLVQMAPLNYIRGRSIANSFMIIDECQNLSPLEIKTIATRVSQGTKIVFTGDVNQIDHPYLDAYSNGLSYLVRKFKGQKIFAHITLTHGERSEVAEMAATLL